MSYCISGTNSKSKFDNLRPKCLYISLFSLYRAEVSNSLLSFIFLKVKKLMKLWRVRVPVYTA